MANDSSDNQRDPSQDVTQAPAAAPPASRSSRLVSLDAFRGLTILGMLLVNNSAMDAATPKQLMHAAWNSGINIADLVYPWFLFIVGVALPYSMASHRKRGLPLWRYWTKAAGRAAMLVGLGCLIDSSILKTPAFGLGVLQLIGLAYLVAALACPLKTYWRLAVACLLLVLHWGAIKFIAAPGMEAGMFTENSNLIKHVNELFLRPYHLAGLISVVPTSALVMIGSALGDLLRVKSIPRARQMLYVLAGGLLLMLAGWLWNLDLPFNKPVWTASYILFTAGLACVVMSLMYGMIDVKGWKAWAFPLVVFGSNAIVAYVAPILVKVFVLQGWTWKLTDGTVVQLQQAMINWCKAHAGTVGGGWLYTCSYIVFWWLILLVLYRKKLFLKV